MTFVSLMEERVRSVFSPRTSSVYCDLLLRLWMFKMKQDEQQLELQHTHTDTCGFIRTLRGL